MVEDADEWIERLLIATADDIDEWIEKLLAELKRVSTKVLAGEREAFAATPSAIERAIREHCDRIDPTLLRPYYKRAKSHLDKLVQQGDSYAETWRRASLLLSSD
jgi:hypothetical protein